MSDEPALDVEALKALAEKASPGPWEARLTGHDPAIVGAGSNWPHGGDEAYATAYFPSDAEFIAAFNPATAKALIAALEEAQRQRDEVAQIAVEAAVKASNALAEVERQRDQARDAAVALEQQNAEALRIASCVEPARSLLDGELAALRALRLRHIVRVLSPDTEGEDK